VIAFLGLLAYDSHLVMTRVATAGVHPISIWKIAIACIVQLSALGFAVWYAALLVRRRLAPSQAVTEPLLRFKVLPFIVPVVLAMASTTLLEIGLFCGDQPFPSVRGRSVCSGL